MSDTIPLYEPPVKTTSQQPESERDEPDRADSDDLALLLAGRFIERHDVKAVQQASGAYRPERTSITTRDVRDHLAGKRTIGHYLLSRENRCKVLCFDIDLDQPSTRGQTPQRVCTWVDDMDITHAFNPREVWLDEHHPARPDLKVQLRCLAEAIAIRTHCLFDIPVAVAYSGSKGVHVYGFTGTESAAVVRKVARAVLDSFGCFAPERGNNFFKHTDGHYRNMTIEIYPKQDDLGGKDMGNLLRLPLGINRKTRQRGFFIDLTKGYDTMEADDPMRVLEHGSLQ